MKTPADKQIVLTLYSHPMKDLAERWKATLTFAPGSTDDSSAELVINDGNGIPVPAGTFEFAGAAISVQDGKGRLRCGDFVKGKHEQGIWLYRRDCPPVPGAVTFE